MFRILFASVLIFPAICCHAESITGRVVGVSDGDTITMLVSANTQHKIRLSGIDAPEKKQSFGQRSKESLSDLVFAKTVTVETDKRDKYQREVGKVLVEGMDANLEQIKRGMAWHYKTYQREQSADERKVYADERKVYADAENEAREAGLGLWSDSELVPPWDFRHNK